MRLIRFLSLLEKIIIFLIILCFIPIAIFAYLPHAPSVGQDLEMAFREAGRQAKQSGFLTNTAKGAECGSKYALALMNELCLDRCTIPNNCLILTAGQSCPFSYSYIVNQTKICTDSPVLNNYIPADSVSFESNNQLLPLESIRMEKRQSLSFIPYCIANPPQCRSLVQFFGHDLEQNFTSNFQTFSTVVQYLMYFGLIPLIAHTVIVFLLDSCGKFNLRLTNSLMIIHQALIGAGIIIAGIAFNSQNDELETNVNKIGMQCVIQASQCHSLAQPFLTFKADDGISSSFVIIMCFILAIQVLLLAGVVVLNFLMVKYYKLREIDPSFSGYELQTL